MQLDRKSVERMLRMDDNSLRQLINRLAHDAGIDLNALNISTADLGEVRRAFGTASDAELNALAAQIEAQRKGGGRDGRGQ
ncbi:MAG: hypothetical protein IJF49_01125 [Clostridia bacterium]|nr:hypothetical protein [Clostridia bacterium]